MHCRIWDGHRHYYQALQTYRHDMEANLQQLCPDLFALWGVILLQRNHHSCPVRWDVESILKYEQIM